MIEAGRHILFASAQGSARAQQMIMERLVCMVCTDLYRLQFQGELTTQTYSVDVHIGLQGEYAYKYEMRQTLNLAEVRIGSQQRKGHHKAMLQLTGFRESIIQMQNHKLHTC